jgi:esterase/lipase
MINDLMPLADTIRRRGFSCTFIRLAGHGNDGQALQEASYAKWYKQVSAEVEKYRGDKRKIYLVGFSLGATLAIDFATENDVEGVFAISTFFKPTYPKLSSIILNIAEQFPNQRIKRVLQATDRRTIKQIEYTPYLPVSTTRMVISEAERVGRKLHNIRCNLLAFHSVNDRVASYRAVVESAKLANPDKIRIVTFRGLNHFLQFDISPEAVVNFVSAYFETMDGVQEEGDHPVKEIHQHCAAEHNHWTSILFQLIVGYFTVFGTFLFFSLHDVLQAKPEAPYYLISYSIVTNIYLLLLMLYFFYVNRVSIFTKMHIEPQLPNITWNTYRSVGYASSEESESMTQKTSLVTFFFPLAISAASLAASVFLYPEKFSTTSDYWLLKFSLLFAVLLFVSAVKSALAVKKYTDREFYLVHRPNRSNSRLECLLMEMYSAISPGAVLQPKTSRTCNEKQ